MYVLVTDPTQYTLSLALTPFRNFLPTPLPDIMFPHPKLSTLPPRPVSSPATRFSSLFPLPHHQHIPRPDSLSLAALKGIFTM